MTALKVTNVKQFMARLLTGEDFDCFLLEEASVSTYNTFLIDGHQNKAFYTAEEWEVPDGLGYELRRELADANRQTCGRHTRDLF